MAQVNSWLEVRLDLVPVKAKAEVEPVGDQQTRVASAVKPSAGAEVGAAPLFEAHAVTWIGRDASGRSQQLVAQEPVAGSPVWPVPVLAAAVALVDR